MSESKSNTLSSNTARLSLSGNDTEGILSQVRLFMAKTSGPEDDSSKSSVKETSSNNSNVTTERFLNVSKRRLSASTAAKQKKPHKRKLKKKLGLGSIEEIKLYPRLSIVDYRKLLLSLLTNGNFKIEWLPMSRPLEKIVFVFVPGLLATDFTTTDLSESACALNSTSLDTPELSLFYDTCTYLHYTTMTGSKDNLYLPLKGLINFPPSAKEKKARAKKLRDSKSVLADLLLVEEQMLRNNYPIHSEIDPDQLLEEGWVETLDFDHEGSHTFALDCEFCQTASGRVLTRISIVNFQSEVVYDTYVKPEEKITNYLTKYSGITEEIANAATATLLDVQKKILDTIASKDILIGHSLDSDLNVIRVKHPRVIDTALSYDHHRGPPSKPGLKWLAERYLGRQIQQGEHLGEGHSSIEDLIACLDLVKMKLIEGPYFGRVDPEISLFQHLDRKGSEKHCAIIDYNPAEYGLTPEDLRVAVEKVSDDDEVTETALLEMESSCLLLLRFQELAINTGIKAVAASYTGELFGSVDESKRVTCRISPDDRTKLLESMNGRLRQIYDRLPGHSLMIVCSEGGDDKEMVHLQSVRRKFQKKQRDDVDVAGLPDEQVWNFDKQSALLRAAKGARDGISFLIRKTGEDGSL